MKIDEENVTDTISTAMVLREQLAATAASIAETEGPPGKHPAARRGAAAGKSGACPALRYA
jgi:hypothetical protein